ncbi:MAG: nitrous oxide-stimulated promoter family protein [Spirochaetaceae bacterium]|nr:nitrous oxide-stimulated promoter family protein [Spirochaetaceae bacterium]
MNINNLLDGLNKKTIHTMISMYCRANHSKIAGKNNGLCKDCFEVEKYSLSKLKLCPYGSKKPNCPKCPIHCYSKNMRERISIIMRYTGPRMIFKHPILSIYHIINIFR